MDHVDAMINSGEIEQFNEQRLKQKHKRTSDNPLPLKTEVNSARITHFEASDAEG